VPRALVTGATGLVGSHLVERLTRDGWEVRALARSPDSAAAIGRAGARVATGDALDRGALVEAARSCDVIFHAAAAIVPRAVGEYRSLNVGGTENAVAAAEASGARLVHVSSVAVYGSAGRYTAGARKTGEDIALVPLRESAHYARSKRDSEALVFEAHGAGRIWGTAVRPDVIYGPRDRHFVPRLGRLLSHGIAPIIGTGKTTLAMVHAANVADGAVRAATTDLAGGRAYNLANDFAVTVEEFFALAAEGLGRRVRVVHVPLSLARGGMRAVQLLDRLFLGGRFNVATSGSLDFMTRDNPFTSERARIELGWDPPVPPSVGVPAAFRWWKESVRST
jgi:nucleoside-diphosphate-sugar epimerase